MKEFAKPFQNMPLVPLRVAKSSLQILFSIEIRVVAACDICSLGVHVVSILYLCCVLYRRVNLPRLDSNRLPLGRCCLPGHVLVCYGARVFRLRWPGVASRGVGCVKV